jgi:hypothetical protein
MIFLDGVLFSFVMNAKLGVLRSVDSYLLLRLAELPIGNVLVSALYVLYMSACMCRVSANKAELSVGRHGVTPAYLT